jgi:tetratricopeptide (TPR) repeat protein
LRCSIPGRSPAQAAPATREYGLTLLELGDLERAEPVLVDAWRLADRARDEPGRAAAANALGLARLYGGRPGEAVEAFVTAAAASPRGVRTEAFAMAKANLALAYERSGATAHARLAARQALGAPVVAEPVRAQAAGVLARLGTCEADLRTVLEAEPTDEERARIVREELLRAADVAEEDLSGDMRAWYIAHTESELEPVAMAELWLRGMLELPPDTLERLARGAVAASVDLGDGVGRETFRTAVTRAMARFHMPQMMRLEEVFATAAADVGDPAPWD